MPGKIIGPLCECAFRACGTILLTDGNAIADMRIGAACGCVFYPCGDFMVRDLKPAESGAAHGGGKDGSGTAHFPARDGPQRGQQDLPQAPPPVPRPAFVQLAPRGLRGRVRGAPESESVDFVYRGMPVTGGGVRHVTGKKKLPTMGNGFTVHESNRQQRVVQSNYPSSVADTGSSYKGARSKSNRRGNAARDEVAQGGQLEPGEEYSGPLEDGEGSSQIHPKRRVEEPHDHIGLFEQHRLRTLESPRSERPRVPFAATSDSAPCGEARPIGLSRNEPPRGTTRAPHAARHTAMKPKRVEVEDEAPEHVPEKEDPSVERADIEDDYPPAYCSPDSTEAQSVPLPRRPHSVRGSTRQEEDPYRRLGGRQPETISTQDISRLPFRQHPTDPESHAPLLPFRERIHSQRSLQSRPPRRGSRRAGKQPEERVRKAAAAPSRRSVSSGVGGFI
ncbi:hypothetical protein MMC32_003912 [Xylographa parallela]|nr:hypothetical protein [Xylographa parallela]